MVSAIGANHPERWSGEMQPYYEAKSEADKYVAESGLDYTIVRPGRLTDDPGTGKVDLADGPGGVGSVTRDDVALVLAEVLTADNTIGKAFRPARTARRPSRRPSPRCRGQLGG